MWLRVFCLFNVYPKLMIHEKNNRTVRTERIKLAKSAVRATGRVWRVFLMPTAPK